MVYANVLGKQGQTMAQANMPNIFLFDEYEKWVFAIAAIPDSETFTIKPFFSIRVIVFPPKCLVSQRAPNCLLASLMQLMSD